MYIAIPHCWRTDNPVIYYARDSWFINSPAYSKEMVASNKTINWQPPEIGAGRFGNWLEDVKGMVLIPRPLLGHSPADLGQ